MSSVVVVPAKARLLVLGLWGVWLLGLLVFVASTVVVGRDQRDVLLDTWLYSALAVGAALLAALRPLLVVRDRVLWSLGALALVVYAAGDVLYSTVVVRLDPEPYPSASDALWLSYYVLAVLLLVGLLRTRARGVSASTVVDGVVVGLGAAAATAALSFDTIRRASAGTALETAVTLGYPVGALVLLGTAGAALAVMGWRVGLQWWALVLGGLVFAVADTAYAYLSATTGYTDGSPVDALWLVALGLQAAAAWLRPRGARHARAGSVATLVLPLGFAAAALVLLVAEHFQRLSLLALVLAAATVAAALLRISLTVGEVRQLATTREQALTDELTGLPNRRRLDLALRTALAREDTVGLLMLDLDRFKDVNDALGHPAGDRLLVEVARRLAGSLGDGELAGRLGGDEFAVLLPGVHGEELLQRGRSTAALLDPPVDLGHISIAVSTSVGAASAPGDAPDASGLKRAADVAMYRAKRRGTGVALYRASADTASAEHRAVLEEFREGFAATGVACTYVPVVDLSDGRQRRLRAVPRWEHPRLGAVPARELLEMVERTGLVRELTTSVLDRALSDRAAWAAAGQEVVVAVSVSSVELLDARLPGTVAEALARHGAPADALVVECSAASLVAEPARSRRALQLLAAAGTPTGVTGHGAGRSAGYLQDLPVVSLTLDGTLSGAAGRDPAATAAVEAAVVLARSLGLAVHVTDVADPGVLRHLALLGVEAADGPAVAEPVEHEQVLAGAALV